MAQRLDYIDVLPAAERSRLAGSTYSVTDSRGRETQRTSYVLLNAEGTRAYPARPYYALDASNEPTNEISFIGRPVYVEIEKQ